MLIVEQGKLVQLAESSSASHLGNRSCLRTTSNTKTSNQALLCPVSLEDAFYLRVGETDDAEDLLFVEVYLFIRVIFVVQDPFLRHWGL